MKTNGSRKAIASAIRRLWFATAIRNCCRRTALGRPPADERRGCGGADGAHRGTAWCTHLRELSTITSVTANETASSTIAIADA